MAVHLLRTRPTVLLSLSPFHRLRHSSGNSSGNDSSVPATTAASGVKGGGGVGSLTHLQQQQSGVQGAAVRWASTDAAVAAAAIADPSSRSREAPALDAARKREESWSGERWKGPERSRRERAASQGPRVSADDGVEPAAPTTPPTTPTPDILSAPPSPSSRFTSSARSSQSTSLPLTSTNPFDTVTALSPSRARSHQHLGKPHRSGGHDGDGMSRFAASNRREGREEATRKQAHTMQSSTSTTARVSTPDYHRSSGGRVFSPSSFANYTAKHDRSASLRFPPFSLSPTPSPSPIPTPLASGEDSSVSNAVSSELSFPNPQSDALPSGLDGSESQAQDETTSPSSHPYAGDASGRRSRNLSMREVLDEWKSIDESYVLSPPPLHLSLSLLPPLSLPLCVFLHVHLGVLLSRFIVLICIPLLHLPSLLPSPSPSPDAKFPIE